MKISGFVWICNLQVMDATSPWCVIYFLLVVWVGGLVCVGLAFAALEGAWEEKDPPEIIHEESQKPGRLLRTWRSLVKCWELVTRTDTNKLPTSKEVLFSC